MTMSTLWALGTKGISLQTSKILSTDSSLQPTFIQCFVECQVSCIWDHAIFKYSVLLLPYWFLVIIFFLVRVLLLVRLDLWYYGNNEYSHLCLVLGYEGKPFSISLLIIMLTVNYIYMKFCHCSIMKKARKNDWDYLGKDKQKLHISQVGAKPIKLINIFRNIQDGVWREHKLVGRHWFEFQWKIVSFWDPLHNSII